MSAIHHGYFAAHRGPAGLVVDYAKGSNDTRWWSEGDPQVLNAKAVADETVAVGTTTDGTVVFFDPATQPDVRPLIPAQRRHADDLSDQSDHVRIPSFGVFVQETLAKQTAKEC